MKETKKEQLEKWEENQGYIGTSQRKQCFEKGGAISTLSVAELQ